MCVNISRALLGIWLYLRMRTSLISLKWITLALLLSLIMESLMEPYTNYGLLGLPVTSASIEMVSSSRLSEKLQK